ncbi:hypothetical protein, partial [Enterococcus faecium]
KKKVLVENRFRFSTNTKYYRTDFTKKFSINGCVSEMSTTSDLRFFAFLSRRLMLTTELFSAIRFFKM